MEVPDPVLAWEKFETNVGVQGSVEFRAGRGGRPDIAVSLMHAVIVTLQELASDNQDITRGFGCHFCKT